MNIIRKPIKININDKEYDFILDFEGAIVFQDLYGKSVFKGIDDITKNQDLKALACLIASCVKDENGAVGMDFVYRLELITTLTYFIEKIGALMENSLPQEEDSKKKVKRVNKI